MTPENCATELLGAWAVREAWLRDAVDAVRAVDLSALQANKSPARKPEPYGVVNSVAVIPLSGPMTKHEHSFMGMLGGTSTAVTRRLLRQAADDEAIQSILLRVDSPGGTVSGTADLADDVRRINRTKKPVVGYAEDLAASAAYWVLSQAESILAGKAAQVGSIGTFAVVRDESGRYDREGVKVHVVKAGERKGDFTAGTQVTKDQLDELRHEVDALNSLFVQDVAAGRGMSASQIERLADGRVHVGDAAKRLGLVDHIATLDDAVNFARTTAIGHRAETALASRPSRSARAPATPREQAEAEWQANRGGCRERFTSRDRYLVAREAELSGRLRVSRRPARTNAGAVAPPERRHDAASRVSPGEAPQRYGVPGETAEMATKAENEWDSGRPTFQASCRENYVRARLMEMTGRLRVSERR